ncbi:MAG: PKD domain-containing protein, partial [Candidatus Lokiarchaeota archaeon]
IKIHRLQDSIVDLEKGIQFLYDFGDETQLKSKEMKVKHQWVNEGTYPVIITGFDDQGAFSQCKKNISIQNEVPIPKFSYSDYSKNGENINPAEILFSAEGSKDTSSDMGTLSYVWDFGDGYFGYGQHTSHIYDRARNFKTTLYVTDDNGATGTISKQVNAYNFNSNIEREQFPNKAPEILGSDTIPQIIEGTMASLESEVYDTFSEEKNLNFAWYDENGRVVSTNRKPSLLLDDGEYTYLLNVTDKGGNYSTKEIKVNVENYAPEVFVSNYWYNGPVYDEMENCSNSGTIQLKAYAFDSLFDINSLSFEWRITDGKDLVTIDDTPGTYFSTIEFHCKKSTIYNGVVEVTDPSGTKGYKTFQIRALIDDNGNGFLNEFEETLKYSGETISNFTDSDNDYLTDINEMLYWKTSPYNKDTDGDGLLDGYDASGIGELTLGTNPLLADSDSDGLNDGYELYGRNISITKMNGKMIIYTTSDPFFNDTDNDGVSDYKEFQLGTNLRVKDTDGDGLDDLNDPFPTTYDQDEDGISDFKEFRLGTCLNQSDTDEDGLQDGEELYGWGIMGFQTNPLLPDNDFDFLSDGSEVKTYHVGLENDYEQEIRVNVTNPLILHFPYRFRQAAAAHIAFSLSFGEDNGDPQVEYGVPSTEVKNLKITIRQSLYDKILYEINTNGTRYYSEDIDITKIMNNKTFGYNYYGDYILEVNDTGAGCLIEQYELEFTRYLDPLNSDFDHDGIMDGVEANLYVRGTKGIDFLEVFEEEEVGEMILNYSAHMGTFIDIPFATPEIGRIYDMDIDLVFQADNELSSDGTIEIILMKVPNNRTLPRDKIFEESRTFYEGTNPTFHLHFDLGNFIHEHEIGAVNGKFLLRFKISPSIGDNSLFNDTFTVTTLKAALSTYTDAKPYNYDAWVTDPALFDTDGDTLSDYQEIYSLHTNPLNSDTDFDNATDNNDRDPHRNLILEITPEYASWYNEPWYLGTPTFQIVMEAHLDDNPTVIYSKPYTANEGLQYTPLPRNVVRNFPEDHYYLDVNDDITLQHEWIIFKLTLYAYTGSLTGHLFIMSGETYYHIRDAGHEQILAVSLRGDTGTDYAKIKVKTLAIEHANTIAIYRKNTTDFTGHYREAERMNIIQLYLNDDTSFTGTPFVQGPNVIVIPTSLFSDTVLNGYIENERLDETSLYSEVEGEFEFYSIDRDGNIQEDANGEDDFVFVRFNINARQAMEILDLLTTCGVNETEDEPGEHVLKTKVLYRYCSTKINGTTANLLNLPNSAMGFVPWFCPYESAEMGPKPTPGKVSVVSNSNRVDCVCIYMFGI